MLGGGGMGVVYVADDPSLGRRVALKFLSPGLVADPVLHQRLLREARSAAAVNHPNIAAVHDIVEADGFTFIVMEYVEGQTLRALMNAGRLSLSRALELGATLAEAISSAHAAGIVHRDLKPENVMLDLSGRLKVLDFGIARPAPDALTTSPFGVTLPALTREGVALGTPGYMSPEQARGLPIDHRTDVFSVGVIIYEMLSGRRPFVGVTAVDLMASTTRDDPPALSFLDARIPLALCALVGRCLAKDPGARPSNLAEVAREILQAARDVAALEKGQTLVSEPSTVAQAQHVPEALAALARAPVVNTATPLASAKDAAPARRPRSLWPLLIALAGAAGIGLALVGGALVLRAHRAASAAVPQPAGAQPTAGPVLGLSALEQYVTQHDSRSAARNAAPAWEAAAADFSRANAQPNAETRWRAAEPFCRGSAQLARGEIDPAEQSFRAAERIEPSWALPHVGLSQVFERRRDRPKALAAAQRAQQLDPKLWLAVRQSAHAYLLGDDFPAAVAELRRALQLSPNNALLLSEIALAYHAAHMDDEAARHAELALARDPELASAHLLLAERDLESSRGKSALDHASRALAVEPQNVATWLAKADALALLGQRDAAKHGYQQALELERKTKQITAPSARLAAVQAALDAGRLPPPRARSYDKDTRTRGWEKPKAAKKSP